MLKNGVWGMNVDCFKRMYRLIDYQRRLCMCDVRNRSEWQGFSKKVSFKQLDYLMMIRLAMPCNLQQVMILTGLSSSAASLFVDKMTSHGVVLRDQDPHDRRNILIRPGKELLDLFDEIDSELEHIIVKELRNCTSDQIEALESSCALVCRRLETINGLHVLP